MNAAPAVFTFDRSPKEFVTGKPVLLINSNDDRRDIIRRVYGIQRVIFAPFDREMMTMPWQDFITELLVKQYGAVHLVAGHDYRFGHKKRGHGGAAAGEVPELGLGCDIIPEVELEGHHRQLHLYPHAAGAGRRGAGGAVLGHPHRLSQTVRHGQRLGRTIGIPTVNLAVPAHVLTPERGVYHPGVSAGRAELPRRDQRGHAAHRHRGDTVSVETYLLGFDGDLYGQTVRLDFISGCGAR